MNLSGENEVGPGGQGRTRLLLRVRGGWETPSGLVSSRKTPRAEENPARPGTASELGIPGSGEPDGQLLQAPKVRCRRPSPRHHRV